MKEIRLARKIISTLVKDHIHYPGRLIVDTLGIIGRCGVLLMLYWYVFKINNGVVNNLTFPIAAWSLFFYFSFYILGLKNIALMIARDTISGNIETLLSKPMSYIFYRAYWQIGSGLYSFLTITTVGVAAIILIIGVPETMEINIFLPTLILVFILGSILLLLLYSIIGILSFWIEEIKPIYWIIDKTVMIFGGSYLPVALFPSYMYKFSIYSPFGASLFITHVVYKNWQTDWYKLISIQLFWIALFFLLVYFIFTKAKQKISINGG